MTRMGARTMCVFERRANEIRQSGCGIGHIGNSAHCRVTASRFRAGSVTLCSHWAGLDPTVPQKIHFEMKMYAGFQHVYTVVYDEDGEYVATVYPAQGLRETTWIETSCAGGRLRGVAETVQQPTLEVDPLIRNNNGGIPKAESGWYEFLTGPECKPATKYARSITADNPTTELRGLRARKHPYMKFIRWIGQGPVFDAEGILRTDVALDAGENEHDRWVTDETIYIKCVDALQEASSRRIRPVFEPKLVLLDPGHGASVAGDSTTTGRSDVGTTGVKSKVAEYKAVFHLAELTASAIKAKSNNRLRVELTKSSAEASLSQLDRAQQTGEKEADVLLSLHFDASTVRKSFCIVLPEVFDELIPRNPPNKTFATRNFNQSGEVTLANKIITKLTAALGTSNGGVWKTGSQANKGVLFETCPGPSDCVHPGGWAVHHPQGYDERLYRSRSLRRGASRVLAVLVEIDSFGEGEESGGDLFFNTKEGDFKEESYEAAASAIAEAVTQHIE